MGGKSILKNKKNLMHIYNCNSDCFVSGSLQASFAANHTINNSTVTGINGGLSFLNDGETLNLDPENYSDRESKDYDIYKIIYMLKEANDNVYNK